MASDAGDDRRPAKPEPNHLKDTVTEPGQIRTLIRDLAKIEDPYLGLSPTMSGTGFASRRRLSRRGRG